MQFEVNVEELSYALEFVKGVVDRRQTIPILSHLLATLSEKELSLVATDSEMTIQKKQIAVEGIKGQGVFTMPARKLLDICNLLPQGAVLFFQQNKNQIIFTANKSRFSLLSLESADFPHIESQEVLLSLHLSARQLITLIESTAFAVADQDVRHYLNGMLWDIRTDAFHTVATDGHRLAKASVPFHSPENVQMIVPRKTVVESLRILRKYTEKLKKETLPKTELEDSIELLLGKGQLTIRTPEYTLTSRLLEGRFPDYTKFIPTEGTIASIDSNQLKEALSRMRVLLNDRHPGIRLEFSQGLLRLLVCNLEQEEAEEKLEIQYQPNSEGVLSVAFNVRYLLDVLEVLPKGLIHIQLQSPDKSVLIKHAEIKDSVYVIMPMRL